VGNGIISAIRTIEDVRLLTTKDPYNLLDGNCRVIQTTAHQSAGASGGPIVNANGEVAGVISFTMFAQNAQSLNFAIAVSELVEALGKRHEPRAFDTLPKGVPPARKE
jgi:S1-C subfamily serine protease